MHSSEVPGNGQLQPTEKADVYWQYLEILIRWWREILLFTLLVTVLGYGLTFVIRLWSGPMYAASAQVAISRVVSNINLDSTFQTEVNTVSTLAQENTARRASLLGLVINGSIATLVIDELGPMLDGVSPTLLMNNVEATFVGSNISDLIQITVTADTPEKAAAIANSWAKHYVERINILYGEIPIEMASLVEDELIKADATQKETQQAYEEFLSQSEIKAITRQIQERQRFLNSLQSNREIGFDQVITQTLEHRQNIISTYLDAIQENRLIAFEGEQDANRTLVQSLIKSIGDNRQLAFLAEQKTRTELFTQYTEIELRNRLLALQQEQNAKTQLFQSYSDADIKAKLTVFNQQIDSKVQSLVEAYTSKLRIEQVLDDAMALQTQVEEAGEASARSNSLPILLLKIEAFAAASTVTHEVSSDIQFDLTGSDVLEIDIENQARDLSVLIDTLTARITELDERIRDQSLSLFNNEGYQLLDAAHPEDDALFSAIQQQYLALFEIGDLAQIEGSIPNENIFSQAIISKYNELFDIGSLASSSLIISDTTPIFVALESQYPSLFSVGGLTQLADALAADSALDGESQEKLIDMLQPLDELENYLAAINESAQPILQLEQELRTLEAKLENLQSEHNYLLLRRDSALSAYNTLNNKLLELTLQRTASNQEVRLASIATPPDAPLPGLSLNILGVAYGIAGFVLALFIAYGASLLNVEPFLSRFPLKIRHSSPS